MTDMRILAGEAEDTLKAKLALAMSGALASGTYGATLSQVAEVQVKKSGAWKLRLTVKITQGGAYKIAWQNLATDPDSRYALTRSQGPTWRAFAKRMQLLDGGVREQVQQLAELVGSYVEVEAKHNPGTGKMDFRLSRPVERIIAASGGVTLTQDGELLSADRPTVAQDAYSLLLKGLGAARVGMSVAAEACWELSREQRWVDLGFSSLNEFLAQPELCMSRTEFFNLATIWEQYVLEGGIPRERLSAAGHSKLAIPLPAIGRGDVEIGEAFSDVESLGARDLREKYRAGRDEGSPNVGTEGPVPVVGECAHCGLHQGDDERGLLYAGRRWPAWVSADMARAAVAIGAIDRSVAA